MYEADFNTLFWDQRFESDQDAIDAIGPTRTAIWPALVGHIGAIKSKSALEARATTMTTTTKIATSKGGLTVAKTPTEFVSDNAGVITSVLAAIAAVLALVRGIVKLYNTRKVQIVEVLEMPGRLNKSLGDISVQISTLKALQDITREALHVATWECDAKGYCIDASPALCELFGLTREQMLGQGWLESIPSSKERDEAWNAWSNSVTNHIPYRHEYQVRNLRTGVVVNCSTTSRAVKDETGEVVKYIGYVVGTNNHEPNHH